jgi:multidrug resistance efflux pump
LHRDRTKTVSHATARDATEHSLVVEGRNGSATKQVLVAPRAALSTQSANGTSLENGPRLIARQRLFRCVRLTLAGGLVSCAMIYARSVFTTARSEQAYINGEITALRAPIPGQVRLEPFGSGRTIRAGATLFRIENARFGNEQAAAQLNWVTELAQRLQAESQEAAMRLQRQEQVTRIYEKMWADQIIPRLDLLEEQSKLAFAATVLTNKLALAKKAAERLAELTEQVQLQQSAVVRMPFDGLVWAVPAKTETQVAVNEAVLEVINPGRMWVDAFFHERHAKKLLIGSEVTVETQQGDFRCRGRVELVRAGVGRIAYDGLAAASPMEHTQRCIAVRVRLEEATPFEANHFYGMGRSVVVTMNSHE